MLGKSAGVEVFGAAAETTGSDKVQTRTLVGGKTGFKQASQNTEILPSTLAAGGRVVFLSPEGSVTLGAVDIASGEETEFDCLAGDLEGRVRAFLQVL